MKNMIIGISGMDLLARLTAIAALCIALPARAGLPYPTASTVSQLIADINYANSVGGTFTINLQTNTTFDLLTYDNYYEGPGINGLPVIGRTNTVNLTIIGNSDTLERDAGAGYQF